MKLSEKKKQELYDEISENIMRLRIEFQKSDMTEKDKGLVDGTLFYFQGNLWNNIRKRLGIE